MDRQSLGLWGEQIAADHLERAGWTIVNRNFRSGRQEVDLIARRGGILAFIEVKTRRNDRFGTPLASVGARKRTSIEAVAEAWITRFGHRGLRYRFDVISIIRSGLDGFRMQHVEDAWGL
jgi:putative endonuclease